jgi:hypothetical protein
MIWLGIQPKAVIDALIVNERIVARVAARSTAKTTFPWCTTMHPSTCLI